MKRILCIVDSMDRGGAETFLMKLLRSMDREHFQMDFATASSGVYDAEIEALQGRIYRITPKSNGLLANFFCILRLVREQRYAYVLRASRHSLSALDLLAARLGGAETLVFRSTNSKTSGGIGTQLLHRVFRPLAQYIPSIKIAPSTEAAELMFGAGCVERGDAVILKNGLDLEQFRFNSEARARLRTELGVENKLVVGHVGRFNQQKNHAFLLKIFSEIHKQRSDAILLLVGQGELESEIRRMAEQLGLTDVIRFLGIRADVPQLLSMMDVLIFPSFYEGMPNVVIEAQSIGLPCLLADTITPEADVTGLLHYLSLDLSASDWAAAAISYAAMPHVDTASKMRNAGYDIKMVCSEFVNLVFQMDGR